MECSSGEAHMHFFEEILHDAGLFLLLMQVRTNRKLQFGQIARSAFGQPELQIVIEQFVRVQLGRITRENLFSTLPIDCLRINSI